MSNQIGLSALDVCARLRKAVADAGGQGTWAAANGVSAQYVHAVLAAKQAPGPQILSALGLRKIVRFVEVRRPAC